MAFKFSLPKSVLMTLNFIIVHAVFLIHLGESQKNGIHVCDSKSCIPVQYCCEWVGACIGIGQSCTQPPTTLSPTTTQPTTAFPTTTAPTTTNPTTMSPTTFSPTDSPTTQHPTTLSPTAIPTTESPTTLSPTTSSPTTAIPTIASPTTAIPITNQPTTIEPISSIPTTFPASTTIVLSTESIQNINTANDSAANFKQHHSFMDPLVIILISCFCLLCCIALLIMYIGRKKRNKLAENVHKYVQDDHIAIHSPMDKPENIAINSCSSNQTNTFGNDLNTVANGDNIMMDDVSQEINANTAGGPNEDKNDEFEPQLEGHNDGMEANRTLIKYDHNEIELENIVTNGNDKNEEYINNDNIKSDEFVIENSDDENCTAGNVINDHEGTPEVTDDDDDIVIDVNMIQTAGGNT